MSSPIRSAYPNKDRITQPDCIRDRGAIYDCVPRASIYFRRRIRCEFLSPAIVIFSSANRRPIQGARKTLRDVERDRI
jgi:hypothetical protein